MSNQSREEGADITLATGKSVHVLETVEHVAQEIRASRPHEGVPLVNFTQQDGRRVVLNAHHIVSVEPHIPAY